MPRKYLPIKTLHGYTLEELQKLAKESASEYTRSMLYAVIMRYKGVSNTTIMNTLGKSRPTIVAYVKKWNDSPHNIIDKRGNNIPTILTYDVIEDIKNMVINHTPNDFGYPQSTWTSALIARYIEDKYGCRYSSSWMRKLLNSFGFSYKRGVYTPTKADPVLQEKFKKNEYFSGYNF